MKNVVKFSKIHVINNIIKNIFFNQSYLVEHLVLIEIFLNNSKQQV